MHSSTMRTAHSLRTGPGISVQEGGLYAGGGIFVQGGSLSSPCEQTNWCKNSTLPQLRLRVLINVALSHRTLFMYSADTDAPEILTS